MDALTLDKKLKVLAKNYLNLEKEILELVIQMDQSKAFYKLGYNSLFSYMTQALQLSPAITYNFINVARKSIEVPELKEQVHSGRLSIYKAQKMTSVLTKENSTHWFELAKSKTHRELEREVALASPHPTTVSKIKYTSPETPAKEHIKIKKDSPRMELQLGVSEKLMLQLRRAQDLESQRKKTNLNLEETLEEVLRLYLEKRDPIKKAQRQQSKNQLRNIDKNSSRELKKSGTKESALKKRTKKTTNMRRLSIPSRVVHQIQLRDQGQCTHIDSQGQRCSSQRFLEVHHIKPVSRGGLNTIDNLALLCSGHHKAHHQRENHSRNIPIKSNSILYPW